MLATACWKIGYYLCLFKRVYTITLQKPGKLTYSDPGAQRPIALLNTIGKVIETLVVQQLSKAAEEHHLLLDTQMGARPGCSTETALELLTRQIHTIWRSKRCVATLLSLDISEAFDIVNPIQLLDTLRKKGLSLQIVQWTQVFITDQSSSLVIQGHKTDHFSV